MKRLLIDKAAIDQAARRLSNDGIWVKREFWTNPDGFEVPADDPTATHLDFLYEVDYDRIVGLVVDHLSDLTVTLCPAVAALDPGAASASEPHRGGS